MERSMILYWICATLANSSQCYGICLTPESPCAANSVSRVLEEALVNDSDTLFMLRQGFFSLIGEAPEHRGVLITLNVTQRESLMNCSPEESNPAFQLLQESEDGRYSYLENWQLMWSSSPVLLLITRNEIMLFDSGIVSMAVMGAVTISWGHKFSFVLNLTDSFRCIPTMQDLTMSLTTLVSWLKAYARAGGVPHIWNREDQGRVAWRYYGSGVSDTRNFDLGYIQEYFRMSLLVMFAALNVLVAILVAKLTPKAYAILTKRLLDNTDLLHAQRRKSHLYSIYWACIFVVGAINLFNVTFSVVYHTMCLFTPCNFANGSWILFSLLGKADAPHNGEHVQATDEAIFIVKIALVPLLLIMELVVSVRTHKDSNFPAPYKLVNVLCCCCCCCCCPTRFQSKFVQTVALWQILVFIQNLTCAVFPVAIFLLVNPLLTASVLLFLLSIFISLIVIAAHLFKLCTSRSYRRRRRPPSYNCKNLGSGCLQFLGILAFFIFIIALFAVYGILIVRGETAGSLLGAVVSLVPSIIIDVMMGWHMKKTFFSNATIVHDPQAHNGQQIGLDDFEDTSDGQEDDEPLLRNSEP